MLRLERTVIFGGVGDPAELRMRRNLAVFFSMAVPTMLLWLRELGRVWPEIPDVQNLLAVVGFRDSG